VNFGSISILREGLATESVDPFSLSGADGGQVGGPAVTSAGRRVPLPERVMLSARWSRVAGQPGSGRSTSRSRAKLAPIDPPGLVQALLIRALANRMTARSTGRALCTRRWTTIPGSPTAKTCLTRPRTGADRKRLGAHREHLARDAPTAGIYPVASCCSCSKSASVMGCPSLRA
jgi:hypothetical protein